MSPGWGGAIRLGFITAPTLVSFTRCAFIQNHVDNGANSFSQYNGGGAVYAGQDGRVSHATDIRADSRGVSGCKRMVYG